MRFAKVYVEITNVCNLACSFCPGTRRPPRFLASAEFETILSRLRGWTEFLYFHLMGEPLLHPELPELLRLAHAQGFRVILTTNGTLLSRCEAVLLSAPGLHKVNLSLQSHEANPGGSLEDYVNQCVSFSQRASRRGVLINFRLWNLDGPDTLGKHSENDRILELLAEGFPRPWAPSRSGFRLREKVYVNFGETFRWPELSRKDEAPDHFCYGLKDQLGVLCDGTVVPCCLDHEGDLALGSLLTQELGEILANPRAAAMLEGFRRGVAVEPLCRRCGYAERFARRRNN